mmetsp:Transcript_1395/g.2454  ORF Transcript_1395/g.2454 Transcript_1395/m.2454 type:complete len:200 (-) Transcript_1395:388-987(-)
MVLQDEESRERALREVEIWSKLSPHPYIVQYIDSALVTVEGRHQEMLILCELCEGGFTLVNMIQYCKLKVPEHVVLTIFHDLCLGVQHMHTLGFSHRDLKVENVLLKDHKFKVGDFGSAAHSKDFLHWEEVGKMGDSAQRQRWLNSKYEDFEKNTTLMYRPPEMIDKYLRQDVNEKADIWMLGCVLFILCYGTHPFPEG